MARKRVIVLDRLIISVGPLPKELLECTSPIHAFVQLPHHGWHGDAAGSGRPTFHGPQMGETRNAEA